MCIVYRRAYIHKYTLSYINAYMYTYVCIHIYIYVCMYTYCRYTHRHSCDMVSLFFKFASPRDRVLQRDT